MAERRIANAEVQATAEVKAAAADLAAHIAETVLTARIATSKSDPLVDAALAQLPDKLN
jgi:F-type H+-transporting ATPase subunit b